MLGLAWSTGPPEKGKGGCWVELEAPGPPRRAKMSARASPECQAPQEGQRWVLG